MSNKGQLRNTKRKGPKKAGSAQQQKRGGGKSSAPAAYATGMKTKDPHFVTRSNGRSVRIRQRELVTNVEGFGPFTVKGFVIQPGDPNTFPWLSTIAPSYERYKFHNLQFEYFTRTGSTTGGSIMLIPEYDVTDPEPASELDASSYNGTREDSPWKDLQLHMPANRLHGQNKELFVRVPSLDASVKRTSDCGKLYLAAVGSAFTGTALWGKLWVSYDVEFFIPQKNNRVAPTSAKSILGGCVLKGAAADVVKPFGIIPEVTPLSEGFTMLSQLAPSGLLENYLKFQYPGEWAGGSTITGTNLGGPTLEPVDPANASVDYFGGSGGLTGRSSLWELSTMAADQLFRLRMGPGNVGPATIDFARMAFGNAPIGSL